MDELRKTTEDLSKDGRPSGQNSNWGPFGHDEGFYPNFISAYNQLSSIYK